jgi:hypothetical protein
MNTITTIPKNTKGKLLYPLRKMYNLFILIAAILLLNSCEKGYDGWPGKAFVGFIWIDDEPAYIEFENEYIPSMFYWDEYYRVAPGLYYVYYEGEHFIGNQLYEYAWELEYEVYEIEGERGRPFRRDGTDGPDTYFTIECSPHGPELYFEEFYKEKSADIKGEAEVIINNGEEIIIEKTENNFGLRLRYKKTEPRGNPADNPLP